MCTTRLTQGRVAKKIKIEPLTDPGVLGSNGLRVKEPLMDLSPLHPSGGQSPVSVTSGEEPSSPTAELVEPDRTVQDARDVSLYPPDKHLAQRPVEEWEDYGCLGSGIWSQLFEQSVLEAKKRVAEDDWTAKDLISFFETRRGEIAQKRKTKATNEFGVRRDRPEDAEKNILTSTFLYSRHYFHGMERAVSLPYDGKNFLEKDDSDLAQLFRERFRGHLKSLRYGLVQGYIDGEGIPLTQYVFCPRNKRHRRCESEDWFGKKDEFYLGQNRESAIWLHTDKKLISRVMEHIESLADKGLKGDLTVIPKIHWWYVHLAPTHRGSGGIAEMLTNTICRLHGVDLPAWETGVAPSVEVLLEPDEERFCQNYHQLFSENRDYLKERFQPVNAGAGVPSLSSEQSLIFLSAESTNTNNNLKY